MSDNKQARYTDISSQQRPLPKDLQKFLPSLTQSGFVRLGEVQRDTPRYSEVPIFVFVHKDELTLAKILKPAKKTFFEFQSGYQDRGLLVTAPLGWKVELPKYRSGAFPILGRGFANHQRLQKKMSKLHGQVVPINSIQDCINRQISFLEESASALSEVAQRATRREIIALTYVAGWIVLFTILVLAFRGYTPALGILMFVLYWPTLLLAIWAHRSYRAVDK